MNQTNKSHTIDVLNTIITISVIFLFISARMYNAYDAAPIGDEGGTYFWIDHSIKDILFGSGGWLTMHWYILLIKGLDWIGLNINQLRLLSLIFTSIGWWFCFKTIKLRSTSFLGLLGVCLLALVPRTFSYGSLGWGYDAYVRSYSLVFMLVCICAYAWSLWCLKKKKFTLFVFFISAGTACIFSLPVSLFFISIIPLLIVIYLKDNFLNNVNLLHIKKDLILVLVYGMIGVTFCYFAQITFLENMLSSHSAYIGEDQNGLTNAYKGVRTFYTYHYDFFKVLFFSSLITILLFKKWNYAFSVVLSFCLFAILIDILSISHYPWAFGRIFYRYFHVIVVGTTVYAFFLLNVNFKKYSMVIIYSVIIYSVFFTISKMQPAKTKGLDDLFNQYSNGTMVEDKPLPLFWVATRVASEPRFWLGQMATRKDLIINGYKGTPISDLLSKYESYKNRGIIVLTDSCDNEADRRIGGFCSYEYISNAEQNSLDMAFKNVILKSEGNKRELQKYFQNENQLRKIIDHLKNQNLY